MGEFPNKATQFQKGVSGNPHGRKYHLTADKVRSVMGRLAEMTPDEIRQLTLDPNAKMLDVMVATIMMKTVIHGDQARFNFLLDRQIGKVTDATELVTPEPFIIKRKNGDQVEMGLTLPEPPPETENPEKE